MTNTEYVSAIEAANALGVGLDYVYKLLWTHKLQGKKVDGLWTISRNSVAKRLEVVKVWRNGQPQP